MIVHVFVGACISSKNTSPHLKKEEEENLAALRILIHALVT